MWSPAKNRIRSSKPSSRPALSERALALACLTVALNIKESEPVAMSGFFEEVKRRKVYRVAVAYVIAAGGIIQLASAAFPAWELPNWSLRLVIVLLLIGFPIALILAWAFDVTSQGIKATPAVAAPGSHLATSSCL